MPWSGTLVSLAIPSTSNCLPISQDSSVFPKHRWLIVRLLLVVHAHGGACGEINVLELVWDHNGQKDPDKEPAPRIAIWVLPRGKELGSSEINAPPCTWGSRSGNGYGCADILHYFGVVAIDRNARPDPAGENDWEFSLEANPRPPCQRP